MIKRLILILLLGLMLVGLGACSGGLANGNLIGVVVRESTGEVVANPALIIGRVLKSPTVPDQQVQGDNLGRFDLVIPGGNYTVQISSNPTGPFYMWPESIYVEEYGTRVVLLELPDGY